MKTKYIVFCIAAFFSIPFFLNAQTAKTMTATKKVAKTPHLCFREVCLGMTTEEAKAIINSRDEWSHMYDDGEMTEYTFFKVQRPIGCEGEKGDGPCYWIERVAIHIFNDHVASISVMSSNYSALEFDHYVKSWAQFGLKVLSQKYGKPTTVALKEIDKVNILVFTNSDTLVLDRWEYPNNESILLSVESDNAEYTASIIFRDQKLEAKAKAYKDKFKSGL